jgi:large subunit ribosomal protein L9
MATKQRSQVRKGAHGGMQLVLTEDVPYLGKQGELVEVKPGYGRNYLLPRGLATIPTEHNLRLLERYKQRVSQAREAKIADLKALADQITNICYTTDGKEKKVKQPLVTIEANANEEGHLYGSVGAPEISRAIKARGLPVEPDMVRLEGPIKEVALYGVKLHLGHDIETVAVVAVVRAAEK